MCNVWSRDSHESVSISLQQAFRNGFVTYEKTELEGEVKILFALLPPHSRSITAWSGWECRIVGVR